jgi:hypothetical protein
VQDKGNEDISEVNGEKNKHFKCISMKLENATVQNWQHLVISKT